MKKELDKFYTNPRESDFFIKKSKPIFDSLIKNEYVFVEPSAGSGNFIKSIKKNYSNDKKIFSFDILPELNKYNIKKMDFLKTGLSDFGKSNNIIFIGNPPFGKRSKLAIDFFNHSAKFGDIIAMIFPLQFRKWSVQSKLNSEFILIKDWNVAKGSFLVNNSEYNVNTCFQIWTKKKSSRINLRILYPPQLHHDDFECFIHNNTKQTEKYFNKKKFQWEFAIHRQGYYDYKKIVTSEKIIRENKNKQWIFIKPKNKIVSDRIRIIDFEKLSQMNTTIPGFGKADLIKEYNDKYK